MQELHLLLAPDKEHKKVPPVVPVVELCNGKNLQGYLVRGKKTSLVCRFISTSKTFTIEACGESFNIQSVPLKFDLEKVSSLLKHQVCGILCWKRQNKLQ